MKIIRGIAVQSKGDIIICKVDEERVVVTHWIDALAVKLRARAAGLSYSEVYVCDDSIEKPIQ